MNDDAMLRARVDFLERVALVAIVKAGFDGRIEAWNLSAERLFGWRAEDVIGKQLWETIIPEQFAELHREAFDERVRTGVDRIGALFLKLFAANASGALIPVAVHVIEDRDKKQFTAAIIRREE